MVKTINFQPGWKQTMEQQQMCTVLGFLFLLWYSEPSDRLAEMTSPYINKGFHESDHAENTPKKLQNFGKDNQRNL